MSDRRTGFTVVELLVAISIVGLLLSLLMPSVQRAREAARRIQCLSNLRQIGAAVHMYEETHRVFPLASLPERLPQIDMVGIRMHTQILPFLDQASLAERIKNRWRAPIFRSWLQEFGGPFPDGQTQLSIFRCPSSILPRTSIPIHSNYPLSIEFAGYATTDYLAVGGVMGVTGMFPMTPFMFVPLRNAASVTDGLSNTLAIGEHSYMGAHGTNFPLWIASYGSREEGNYLEALHGLNCVETFSGQYWRTASSDSCALSLHPDVVCFSLGDGSARVVPETIDRTVYVHLCGINDGEVVPEF